MNQSLFSSNSNEWSTPINLFNRLDDLYHFTLDPAASLHNHKCSKFYTINDNGLKKSWENEIVFLNPPYGRELHLWIEKAFHEYTSHHVTSCILIPARTDTRSFHDIIFPWSKYFFFRGRIKFSGSNSNAPFPSMLVVFDDDFDQFKNYLLWRICNERYI